MLALNAGGSTPNRATKSMLPLAAVRVSRLTIFRQVTSALRRNPGAEMSVPLSPTDGLPNTSPFWM